MRLPRIYAPDLPHLVEVGFSDVLTQRWVKTIDSDQFDQITQWFNDAAKLEELRVHAWSITPRALRIIATPPNPHSLSRVVQAVGRRLGGSFRQGPVFHGRYRSCLLEPARWVIPAIIWLERAPVRDGCTPNPIAWRWSSALSHTGTGQGLFEPLSFHHDYWACGNTPFDRQAHHRTRLSDGLPQQQISQIDQAVHGQWALGSPAFLTHFDSVATRRVTPAKRGRPRMQTT